MKLRAVSVAVGFLSLVLPMLAQDSNNTLNPSLADKSIILNNTTITLNGPNGTSGSAPTVLQVAGGAGGAAGSRGTGGGVLLEAGTGAAANYNQPGGTGGAIQISSGQGGSGRRGVPGGNGGSVFISAGNTGDLGLAGGSITLLPGAGGSFGRPGNVVLAPTAGNVGIGEVSPDNTLEVVTGGTTLADAWTTRSSRRFKTSIRPLEGALERVKQLQGVSYQRRSDGKPEIGMVAEDVDNVVPEVVSHDPKTHEVQGVDYSRLAALLIEAIKSQQAEIQQLKVQIGQLTSQNTARGQ